MDKMASQDRELRENFVGGQTSIPTSYTERHAPKQSYKPKGTQLPRAKPRPKPWGVRYAVAPETLGNTDYICTSKQTAIKKHFQVKHA